jgi:hypothetical protein
MAHIFAVKRAANYTQLNNEALEFLPENSAFARFFEIMDSESATFAEDGSNLWYHEYARAIAEAMTGNAAAPFRVEMSNQQITVFHEGKLVFRIEKGEGWSEGVMYLPMAVARVRDPLEDWELHPDHSATRSFGSVSVFFKATAKEDGLPKVAALFDALMEHAAVFRVNHNRSYVSWGEFVAALQQATAVPEFSYDVCMNTRGFVFSKDGVELLAIRCRAGNGSGVVVQLNLEAVAPAFRWPGSWQRVTLEL